MIYDRNQKKKSVVKILLLYKQEKTDFRQQKNSDFVQQNFEKSVAKATDFFYIRIYFLILEFCCFISNQKKQKNNRIPLKNSDVTILLLYKLRPKLFYELEMQKKICTYAPYSVPSI